MAGRHVIKTWSSTQQVVALSSGEAELYALMKVAVQVKGIMSMYLDYGIKLAGAVYSDANAAIGIVHREGLGRTRHIDVSYLWIQQEVKSKKLDIRKVNTHENPADILTKGVTWEVLRRHMQFMNFAPTDVDDDAALTINAVTYCCP